MASNEKQLSSPPTDGISALCFSPSSPNLLLASSWDQNVRLYDVEANEQKATYSHMGAVLDCALASDSKAFSAGLDCSIKAYDFEKQVGSVIGRHGNGIRKVAYNPDHNVVVSGSWDCTCGVWDERTSGATANLTLPGKVFAMSVLGDRIVVGMSGRHVHIYDLRNLSQPEQRRESSLKFQTRDIACYPNKEGYALSSVEGRVAMEYFSADEATQARKYAFKCHRRTEGGVDVVFPVNALAFHPLGTFASGGCDGLVNIWDGENKKRLCQYRRYPTSIAALAFNRDGSRLAVGASYTFEEGEKESPPADSIFIRTVADADVTPKPKQRKA